MAFSDSEAQQLAKAVVDATSPPERWHVGWHLKKEIQLTHVISTVTLALSAVWYMGKIEQRIAIVERQQSVQSEKDATQDQVVRESLALLRQDLSSLNAKLDRLIEREVRKP